MKSDTQPKTDITDERPWDPSVKAPHGDLSVRDGVATRARHLETCAEKLAAESARAAGSAVRWHALVAPDRVHIQVENGGVPLSGDVDREGQRNSAESAVRPLERVISGVDRTGPKFAVPPGDVSNRVREAMSRHAERESKDIDVRISCGSTVPLTGRVDSRADRLATRSAAGSCAPGVSAVVDHIAIGAPA